MTVTPYFPLSLPVAVRTRDELGLNEVLGEDQRPELFRLRLIAERLRERRGVAPVSAARLNLLRQQNRVFAFMAQRYFTLRAARFAADGVVLGDKRQRVPQLPPTLSAFAELFPPGASDPAAVVARFSRKDGKALCQAAVAELFILDVQNGNAAARPFAVLFADDELRRAAPYPALLDDLARRLLSVPVPGLFALPLPELLRAPLRAAPDSLEGQLRYIREVWGAVLPEELLQELLISFDLLQEEEQQRGGGPGPLPQLGRGAGLGDDEPERFSPDSDWMPNVVLMAKTIYVWLDQLSRRYGANFYRLDHIPDAELDRLARAGFTSLWLIGIWERSPASAEIKRRMGNAEAVASAYSLFDYTVAGDLGGEAALDGLVERCRARGIRLACDVVPNHTGIDSRWTREHPDWFVQVEHPPYPVYNYAGPDLSSAGHVSLRIEDGYWSHRDAAVVFQHVDHGSGRTRYIYHGNDGTHLPWHDTAQLNFLIPEVREAMIRTIIHVARRFPVIRFDAAMTLAKKHYQRLWFPQPGGGAGVPSRSEHALTRERFDELFPVEFWREVVDRVAAEVPDTLLLAEAFWLMEGYFVRTLGMHRVYNSAFMHMLKQEDNAKYRGVLKNILEFEPEILKRFVNFMNNPDEETAVAQFGRGDKYFGVAVMLATLPGLPMFGHGQLEGLEEKYGMEYRRAYRDEAPDAAFIAHHEAQIFPLLRRRRLFSGSQNFVLYDFGGEHGVNEDVYAYSNGHGSERAVVVMHNRYAETRGWIRDSVLRRVGDQLERPNLGAALGLSDDRDRYIRFREHRSGLTWLRPSRELARHGLELRLGPYEYQLFLDFVELQDDDGSLGKLCRRLAGRPVADLDREWQRLRFAALHQALPRALNHLAAAKIIGAPLIAEIGDLYALLSAAAGVEPPTVAPLLDDLEQLQNLLLRPGRRKAETLALAAANDLLGADAAPPAGASLTRLLPWLLLRPCLAGAAANRFNDLLLAEPLAAWFAREAGADPELLAEITGLLLHHADFGARGRAAGADFAQLLDAAAVQRLLGCNWHEGVLWFNRERFFLLIDWLLAIATVNLAATPGAVAALAATAAHAEGWRQAARASGYRFANLRQLMVPPPVPEAMPAQARKKVPKKR